MASSGDGAAAGSTLRSGRSFGGSTVAASRLRYVFDRIDQVARHFRTDGTHARIQFVDGGPSLDARRPVFLEVALRGTARRCYVRGLVGEPVPGGMWLEFDPDASAKTVKLLNAPGRRRGVRVPIDLPARVWTGGAFVSAHIVDLSQAGARLSGLAGKVAIGDDVIVAVAGAALGAPIALGNALVVRGGDDVGVKFTTREVTVRAALERVIATLQNEWKSVREASHPFGCC